MARARDSEGMIHETPNLHPSLLITDRSIQNEKQYLYSISENRFHLANIPEFHEMDVLASAYGWIVLAHPQNDNCYIWNPSSMQKIEIGLLKFSFVYNKCVMSKPPLEPGYCHIMFYSSTAAIPSQCLLLDGETVAPPSYLDYDNGDTKVHAAASFQGKIYCIVKPGLFFAIVDFDGTTVKYVPILKVDTGSVGEPWGMPEQEPDWLWCPEFHIIKSSSRGQLDELLLVKKQRMCDFLSSELDFKVFRIDIDRRECLELDNIGERAIFLSYHGDCFCCSSLSSRGMYKHNCIYYTIPDNESRCVYVYDLDDRSTTPLLPCPAARRSRTVSIWIEKDKGLKEV